MDPSAIEGLWEREAASVPELTGGQVSRARSRIVRSLGLTRGRWRRRFGRQRFRAGALTPLFTTLPDPLLANLVFEPALEVVDEERLDEVVAALPEGAVDLEVYVGNMRSDPMSYNRSFFSQIEGSLARRCVVLPVGFGFELGETGFFGGGALEVGGHPRVYESALFTSFLTTFCFGMMALAGYGDEPLGFKDRYDTEAYLSECVHNYVFLHNGYSFERGIGLLRFGVFMGEKGAQLRFAMELFALMHEVSHIILGTVDSAGIEDELAADRLGFDLFGKVFRDIDYVQGPGGVEEMIWAPLLFFYVLC